MLPALKELGSVQKQRRRSLSPLLRGPEAGTALAALSWSTSSLVHRDMYSSASRMKMFGVDCFLSKCCFIKMEIFCENMSVLTNCFDG